MTDEDLLIVQQHAIDSLDSSVCGLGSLIVDVTVTTRSAVLIVDHLARQNVTERRERIMERLVASH